MHGTLLDVEFRHGPIGRMDFLWRRSLVPGDPEAKSVACRRLGSEVRSRRGSPGAYRAHVGPCGRLPARWDSILFRLLARVPNDMLLSTVEGRTLRRRHVARPKAEQAELPAALRLTRPVRTTDFSDTGPPPGRGARLLDGTSMPALRFARRSGGRRPSARGGSRSMPERLRRFLPRGLGRGPYAYVTDCKVGPTRVERPRPTPVCNAGAEACLFPQER